MFLFGLGLWDKANFVWFLAGLAVTVAVLFPREVFRRRGAIPLALVALLLGAAPLLFYNWTHRGQTWRERGRLEVRWDKLDQAKGTFNGDFMSALTGEESLDFSPPAQGVVLSSLAHAMYRFGRVRQTILLPLLAVAVLLLPLTLRIDRSRALLFPFLLSVLTYACMFLTFEGGASVHHVIMLQPFPLLFLSASLWTLVKRWPHWTLRVAVLIVVMVAITANLSLNARHLAIYTRTGGTGRFTDAVYSLVPFLARNPSQRIYALDWGFANPVLFLGYPQRLYVDEIFFSIRGPEQRLANLMRDPGNLFLLHSPERTLFPVPRAAFLSIVDSGIPMRRIAEFRERSGQAVYEVYQGDILLK